MNADETTTETPQGTVDKYLLTDDAKLFREGVHIADVNADGEVIWTDPAHSTYKAAVTRWINAKAKQEEQEEQAGAGAAGVSTPDPQPSPVVPTPPVLTAEQQNKADESGMQKEAEKSAAKAESARMDDAQFAAKAGCPQPPKKNPQFGDKTPAYVEWLKTYRPEVFAARYRVVGTGNVPVYKQNSDGIEEHAGYRVAIMSTRKTHLTEKAESAEGIGKDESWDA